MHFANHGESDSIHYEAQPFGSLSLKEITEMTNKINIVAPKSGSKEIAPQLDLGIEKDTEINGNSRAFSRRPASGR